MTSASPSPPATSTTEGRSLSTMHADALSIFSAALKAADPAHLISQCLSLSPHPTLPSAHLLTLRTRTHSSTYTLTSSPPPSPSPTPHFSSVLLIAVGKAAVPMAAAAHGLLSPTPYLRAGLVVTKHAPTSCELPFPVREAGHPLPTEASLEAASAVLALLREHSSPSTLTLFLLSGGASALLEKPREPLTLDDVRTFTQRLLDSGAPIQALNALRCAISQIKGGGVAREARGPVVGLVLSDVVGDDVRVIGSGPTVRQKRDRAKCAALVARYGLGKDGPHALPPSVLSVLLREEDDRDADNATEQGSELTVVVGSSLQSLKAAKAEAERRGYRSLVLTDRLTGDVASVHALFPGIASTILSSSQPSPTPACIITGGETTVLFPRTASGSGGRNQHLALLSIPLLSALPSTVLLAAGTDGGDGPTDAAGAVVTNDSARQAEAAGLDCEDWAERYDSFGFFKQLDERTKGMAGALSSHLITGPTGTNVMDITVLLVDQPHKSCKL